MQMTSIFFIIMPPLQGNYSPMPKLPIVITAQFSKYLPIIFERSVMRIN